MWNTLARQPSAASRLTLSQEGAPVAEAAAAAGGGGDATDGAASIRDATLLPLVDGVDVMGRASEAALALVRA